MSDEVAARRRGMRNDFRGGFGNLLKILFCIKVQSSLECTLKIGSAADARSFRHRLKLGSAVYTRLLPSDMQIVLGWNRIEG